MFDKLTTMVKILRALRSLRAHERWDRATLLEHQASALRRVRAYAYARSPFYQELHRGYQHAPLSELPILTKATMMEHFDRFVTARDVRLADVRAHLADEGRDRFRNTYEVAATSGSTGQPGIFLFDPDEWATVIASFARAREWAGIKLDFTRRSRMAVVSSTNEHNVSARVGKVANTSFLPTLRLDATQPLGEIVAALHTWQPEVLVAYASMASFLASEQAAGALDIRPRAVFTSSEVLTPQMRRGLEKVWGNVVFNEYASTEAASIAAEDTGHHGMHLFEDLLIVENVDAHNQPVAPGAYGEKLLVTVLFSRTQPLIRYEVSDSVRFAVDEPTCRLPFRTIAGVQGRQEDILILGDRNNQPVPIHPNVFHDVMDTVPNHGWQIVQEPHALRVQVVPAVDTPEAASIEARIVAKLSERGVEAPRVRLVHVSAIPKAASGKTPLIKAQEPAREQSG